ncbi:hypothetical protein D3C71_1373160 [compost metagenome]
MIARSSVSSPTRPISDSGLSDCEPLRMNSCHAPTRPRNTCSSFLSVAPAAAASSSAPTTSQAMAAKTSALPAVRRVSARRSWWMPSESARSTLNPWPSGSFSAGASRADGKPSRIASALSGERRPACTSTGPAGGSAIACQPSAGSSADSDVHASRNSSFGRAIFLKPVEVVDFVFHADSVVASRERDGKGHDGFIPFRHY